MPGELFSIVWHVTSRLYTEEGGHVGDSVWIAHRVMKLSVFLCLHPHTAMVNIYRGMLTDYWTRWRLQPIMTHHCNATNKTAHLQSHVYSTITLTYIFSPLKLKMEFKWSSAATLPKITSTSNRIHSSEDLLNNGGVKYGVFHFTSTEIKFLHFTCHSVSHATNIRKVHLEHFPLLPGM